MHAYIDICDHDHFSKLNAPSYFLVHTGTVTRYNLIVREREKENDKQNAEQSVNKICKEQSQTRSVIIPPNSSKKHVLSLFSHKNLFTKRKFLF